MQKILITEFMHPPSATTLEAHHQVHYGPDLVDRPQELAERGIPVIPATGTNTNSVAEYVIAAVMVLLRGSSQCSNALAK